MTARSIISTVSRLCSTSRYAGRHSRYAGLCSTSRYTGRHSRYAGRHSRYAGSQSLVFDITLCGQAAGPAFAAACPGKGKGETSTGQCIDFVRNNPSAFSDAYWLINSVIVYSNGTSSLTLD